MPPLDAEVPADIGDDGADGPTADFRGNPLRRGEVDEIGMFAGRRRGRGGARGAGGAGRGCALRPGFRVQAAGGADQSRFEGLGAKQAAGDVGDDQRNVGGAEVGCIANDAAGGGVLVEGGGCIEAVILRRKVWETGSQLNVSSARAASSGGQP
jgi:hypothetical protein